VTEKTISQILTTKDYGRFVLLPYNREVEDSRVDRIANVIKEDGFLVPILATSNYEVIDGQHRLAAARKVGCAVSYLLYHVEKEKVPLVVSKLNATAKTWGLEQYHDMWVKLHKDVYVRIEEIRLKHELSFSVIDGLLCAAMPDKGGTYDIVRGRELYKSGKFTMTESQYKRLDEKCSWWNEIVGYSPKFDNFGKAFRSAVTDVIRQKNYDHDIMKHALVRGAGSLLGCHARAEYVIQLVEEYNRVAKGDEKIRLMGKKK
jgi:hypothetical protein